MPQSADPDPEPDPSSDSESEREGNESFSDMDICCLDDGERERLPLVFPCPLRMPLP